MPKGLIFSLKKIKRSEPETSHTAAVIPARQSCPLGTVMAHGGVVVGERVGALVGNFREQMQGWGGWKPESLAS